MFLGEALRQSANTSCSIPIIPHPCPPKQRPGCGVCQGFQVLAMELGNGDLDHLGRGGALAFVFTRTGTLKRRRLGGGALTWWHSCGSLALGSMTLRPLPKLLKRRGTLVHYKTITLPSKVGTRTQGLPFVLRHCRSLPDPYILRGTKPLCSACPRCPRHHSTRP